MVAHDGRKYRHVITIVLDGYVYSAPRVNSKIDKGQSQITGDFTIQEAKDLANVLNSGKVPRPAKIIQDTVVVLRWARSRSTPV